MNQNEIIKTHKLNTLIGRIFRWKNQCWLWEWNELRKARIEQPKNIVNQGLDQLLKFLLSSFNLLESWTEVVCILIKTLKLKKPSHVMDQQVYALIIYVDNRQTMFSKKQVFTTFFDLIPLKFKANTKYVQSLQCRLSRNHNQSV